MESTQSDSRPIDVSALVQAGISAARAGHHGWARDLLLRATELDDSSVAAWAWLVDLAESQQEKEYYLDKVFAIDPDHDVAGGETGEVEGGEPAPEPQPAPAVGPANQPGAVPQALPVAAGPGSGPETSGVSPGIDFSGQLANVARHSATGRARTAAGEASPAQLDVDTLLQQGVDAAYARDAGRARELLARVVEIDQDHLSAWLWLSYVSDSPEERDRCVARVLSLAGQPAAPGASRPSGGVASPPDATLEPSAASGSRAPVSAIPHSAAPISENARASPARSSAAVSAAEAWSAAAAAVRQPTPIRTPRSAVARPTSQPVYAGIPAGRGGYEPPEAPLFRSMPVQASVASNLVRGAIAEWTSTWGIIALAYLAGITLAEALTTFARPQLGLAAHSLVLLVLVVHAAQLEGQQRAFVLSLAFAPLIRILSLSLPMVDFPLLYWYLITSIPLFAGAVVAARSLSYTWRDLGLTLRGWPLQIAIALSGIAFGCIEYLILRPDSLLPTPDWRSLAVAALILTVSTGLLEELIFRGLLQRAAGDLLGRWGLTYVALLFAVLHVGYRSAADLVFVFAVGLFLGWIVQRTRSLLGVTLAHGATNVVLFLIMPLLHL